MARLLVRSLARSIVSYPLPANPPIYKDQHFLHHLPFLYTPRVCKRLCYTVSKMLLGRGMTPAEVCKAEERALAMGWTDPFGTSTALWNNGNGHTMDAVPPDGLLGHPAPPHPWWMSTVGGQVGQLAGPNVPDPDEPSAAAAAAAPLQFNLSCSDELLLSHGSAG